MGLFGGTVTTVATSVSRVIENAAIPNAVTTGTTKSVLQNSDFTEALLSELQHCIGLRAERMYDYAEDSYTYGLPSGEVYSSTQGRQEVEQVIEGIESQQVLVKYSHFGAPNAMHIGWMKLFAEHSYDPVTNKLGVLTASKNTPVYLKDMVVVVPAAQASTYPNIVTALWGTAASTGYTPERPASGALAQYVLPTPVLLSNTATNLHLLVTYTYQAVAPSSTIVNGQFVQDSGIRDGTFTISVSEFDLEDDYFQAKYIVNGQPKYWMYLKDSGGYPALDTVFTDTREVAGTYFPFAYFRFGKQSTISNKNTAGYKTTKRMLEKLGMDIDTVGEAINSNEDIDDVEQALLLMAVPAISTNALENRYLFEYFDNMYAALGGNTSSPITDLSQYTSAVDLDSQSHTQIIKDKRFKMALSNKGIDKKLRPGKVGKVGECFSVYGESSITTIRQVDFGSLHEVPYITKIKLHKYQRQITDSLYEEIIVRDLRMTYFIYGRYSVTADTEKEKDILLIPIDRNVTETYSVPDKERLYARSLHFVFNSRVVTHLKWYQSDFFKGLVFVVAVVLTVMDMGSDGGSWLSFAANYSLGQQILLAIIINVGIGLVMNAVFDLAVKVLGTEAAQVLAIVAILYGGYKVFTLGKAGLITAERMLMVALGLENATIRLDMENLIGEYKEFQDYAKEQTKLLDSAKELLGNSNVLSPLVIFGEKPEDFYNRTVHSGNVGTLGITAISYYVDLALTLPKLKDTVGEDANA